MREEKELAFRTVYARCAESMKKALESYESWEMAEVDNNFFELWSLIKVTLMGSAHLDPKDRRQEIQTVLRSVRTETGPSRHFERSLT